MILFFGNRLGQPQRKALTLLPCPHCRQLGSLTLVSRSNRAHIFWIPLFKLGTIHHVECSHCKRVFDRKEFSPEMDRALERP